ncbi:flagellar motor switch protein FliN [Pseudidiomarina salinarum]|uniref:Flagellar motor switch protein FliN n=1 Tax=Pseudidiomarina salinarum TaxID=435908 RepID=A0A094ITD5_9GAMM|nr:flagellar motor switch protein FliN [Pseudidiomarina salinarum]KFZ30940.1 flagellar motor switch protein FliN [Pseudidiomarina salinarum]RUO71428.1 flagellar motor switch protein FliN [Pseudidiomarina salinarum]
MTNKDQDQSPADQDQDPWADALAEEQQAAPTSDSQKVFKPLDNTAAAGGTMNDLDIIMDIPVKLSVELGRTRITIKQLLELAQGSVVELDGLAGEPMDILINGYLIAQGEVVVLDDKYGIRITEIVTPSERVQKLNR